MLGIDRAPDGFFASREWFRLPHDSTREGILVVGCAMGMKPIRNCIVDGSAVAATRRGSVARQSDRRRDCGNDLKAGRSGPAAMPTAAPPDDKREPWFRVHPAFFANSDVWPYDS